MDVTSIFELPVCDIEGMWVATYSEFGYVILIFARHEHDLALTLLVVDEGEVSVVETESVWFSSERNVDFSMSSEDDDGKYQWIYCRGRVSKDYTHIDMTCFMKGEVPESITFWRPGFGSG